MILASCVLLLARQNSIDAPVIPPGCSTDFQRTVIAVEQSLEAGDFATAAKRVQLLPKRTPLIAYKDDLVPSSQREIYRRAAVEALNLWKVGFGEGFEAKLGSPSDVLIDFGAEMAKLPNSDAPASMANFVSQTTLPRLESVLGLHRGIDHRTSNEFDIVNDVEAAIGTYLGIAPTGLAGTAMGHVDYPSLQASGVTPNELQIAKANLAAVEVLRQAIHAQRRMTPSKPSASIDTDSFVYGPVLQGQPVSFAVGITNVGSGQLTYSMRPECSCISVGSGGVLGPGESRVVDVRIDTLPWSKTMQKSILLLTNDPETPVRKLPIEVKIQSRYRWIVPGGGNRVVGDGPTDVDLYLDTPPEANIFPSDPHFEGIPGKVTKLEPWQGVLADPISGEGALPRQGYHIVAHVDALQGYGRPYGTVVLQTSNKDFPELRFTLGFQKGIVALPQELHLGDLSTTPKPRHFYLSRPGKPFRILSIKSSSPVLKTSVVKVPESGDFQIVVTVEGKVQPGDFLGILHIYTDDPAQPKVDVTVDGIGG